MKSRGYVLVYTEFDSDPRFELQRRYARFFLGRLKTWNCCDALGAKNIFVSRVSQQFQVFDLSRKNLAYLR